MKFSFILCTLNREQLLEQCVNSIISQNYQNFEIIIIDQSDKKNKNISKVDKRIKYVFTLEKGLSHARNLALQYVTGDYCCLMDDDAEYEYNTLQKIYNFIEKYKCDVSSGVILDKETKEKWMSNMPEQLQKINKNNVFFCSSASLVIKTELLKKYKFDENLGAGKRWSCGEETDLLLRLLYDNYKIIYNPDIIIYHPKEYKDIVNINKVYKYNLGYGAYFAKHIIDYKNYSMIFIFFKALIKNVIALIIFIFNKNKKLYYKNCLSGKIKGYFEWCNQRKKQRRDDYE